MAKITNLRQHLSLLVNAYDADDKDALADIIASARYADWRDCARMLIADFGYSVPQAVKILNSKWTRWASDAAPTTQEENERYYGVIKTDVLRGFVTAERAAGRMLP